MQKILITGGAGFIGSHLANKFSKFKKTNITIVDNLSTGNMKNLNGFEGEFVNGDIRDSSLIDALVSSSDIVLHMAAALGVKNIMEDTVNSISTNILGSEVVLLSAAKHKKRIIIASSSEVYGKNPKQPLKEDDDRVLGTPQNFRWSYSDSKAIEESIARVLFLNEELPVTTLRFFNTIGTRQTGQYGMVVPRFVKAAISGEELEVHGTGEQTRVFCNVSDVVSAVEGVLDSDVTLGEVYNVGGFGEISIMDLARKVIDLTDSKSKIVTLPYSEAYPAGYEDMLRRVPDSNKLKSAIGWEAKVSLESSILEIAAEINQTK